MTSLLFIYCFKISSSSRPMWQSLAQFQIADIMSSFGGNLTSFEAPSESPVQEEFNLAFEAYMDQLLTCREKGIPTVLGALTQDLVWPLNLIDLHGENHSTKHLTYSCLFSICDLRNWTVTDCCLACVMKSVDLSGFYKNDEIQVFKLGFFE